MEKALDPLSPRQSGFTLIEVMVALIVLVLGVLGAAAMTLTAVKDSKQSALRSQASALAYELGDLMRSTRDETPSTESIYTGSAPTGAVSSCWTSGCTLTQMATNDYYEWRQKLQNASLGLPNGQAVICHDKTMLASFPACDNDLSAPLVVKLQWDEKQNVARGQNSGASAVVNQLLVVTLQPAF